MSLILKEPLEEYRILREEIAAGILTPQQKRRKTEDLLNDLPKNTKEAREARGWCQWYISQLDEAEARHN